jgi:hypothetical protein
MGLAWLFRRRRAKPAAPPAPDPAEELKQKLAESRSEEQPARADEPEPPPAELDERRREVHERARASIEQMRGQPPEG